MTKIDLIKMALATAKEQTEIDKLNKELLDAIREEERVKLEKEFQAKADADAKAKAQAESTNARPVASGVKVGEPDRYKGRKLKMEIEALGGLSKRWNDEGKASIVARAWIDGLDKAMKRRPGETIDAIEKAVIGQSTTAGVGGYLNAPEYSNEYLEYAKEFSRALQICRVIPMNTTTLYMPAESAKVSVAQTSEGTDATVTSTTFAQITLTAKRYDAYTGVTNELLNDENVPILPILISQFTEAYGQKIDSAVFNGTGDPMSSPFTAAAGHSVVLGTGSAAFSSFVYSNFIQLVGKLPDADRRNARWAINRAPLWTYIYNIKDTTGRPLFLDYAGGAITGPTDGRILGLPVVSIETGPSTTAVSTAMAVLGDWQGVLIGQRLGGVDLFLDPYTAGKSYQTNIYCFQRWAFAMGLANKFARLVTASA